MAPSGSSAVEVVVPVVATTAQGTRSIKDFAARAAELTVGHYLTPAGRSLDGVGVQPDVAVPARASSDVFTERAIEVLSGLTADAGSSGRG